MYNKTLVNNIKKISTPAIELYNDFHQNISNNIFSLIYNSYLKKYGKKKSWVSSSCKCVSFDGHAALQIQEESKADAIVFSEDFEGFYNPNKQYVIISNDDQVLLKTFIAKIEYLTSVDRNIIILNSTSYIGHDVYQVTKKIIDNLHKDNNIPHENIVLIGNSLMGAMFLQIAADNEGVKVLADRTFADLSTTLATTMQNIMPTTFMKNTLGMLLFYVAKAIVRQLDLNIDAAAAFDKINLSHPGDAKAISMEDDNSIPECCNLESEVEYQHQNLIKKLSHKSKNKNDNILGVPYLDSLYDNKGQNGFAYILDCLHIYKKQILPISPKDESVKPDVLPICKVTL